MEAIKLMYWHALQAVVFKHDGSGLPNAGFAPKAMAVIAISIGILHGVLVEHDGLADIGIFILVSVCIYLAMGYFAGGAMISLMACLDLLSNTVSIIMAMAIGDGSYKTAEQLLAVIIFMAFVRVSFVMNKSG